MFCSNVMTTTSGLVPFDNVERRRKERKEGGK